jgi:tellurite resistance protein TerC
MDVTTTAWAITLAVVFGVYLLDFLVASRRPHVVGMREAAVWVSIYVAAAVAFGWWVWATYGAQFGQEFFAGWITEYSLSVDNLFVFVIIMSSFAVPREYQQKVLQIGIVGALVLRFVFIIVGAAALEQFSSLFYVFGAFLIYTAVKLASGHGSEGDPAHNRFIRRIEHVVPVTSEYHGGSFTTRIDGKRVFTPMFVVMVAIFSTDLLFALDSIPAIFGLTEEPYIVFTANAFALMGLRQLYFLLDGLLDRLVYLSYGLAVILGFIGVKLLLHALHSSGFHVPQISTRLSLVVIVGVLIVTVLASLLAVRRDPSLVTKHGAHRGEVPGDALQDIAEAEHEGAGRGGPVPG